MRLSISQLKSSFLSRLSPVSLHQPLQPEAGLQGSGTTGLLQLCMREVKGVYTFCRFHVGGEETWSRLRRETQVNKNASGGQMSARKASDSALEESCDVQRRITAAADIWRRRHWFPRVPALLQIRRQIQMGGEGWGGDECVWIHVAVMLDLDAFQKSTPYALVTEWIIPRCAGSRLICR